jgi:hypothetical protein
MKEGDWFCKTCKVVIFKNKTECLKCGQKIPLNWNDTHTVKPYVIGTLPNYHYDWKCPKCNAHIFGSKRHCMKCLVRNPVLPDDL